MIKSISPAKLAVGFQTISLANTTAVAINSTCRQSNRLEFTVETGAARYRADTTAPTNTTGVLLVANTHVEWDDYNGTSLLKFCRKGNATTATIHLMAYKYKSTVR